MLHEASNKNSTHSKGAMLRVSLKMVTREPSPCSHSLPDKDFFFGVAKVCFFGMDGEGEGHG